MIEISVEDLHQWREENSNLCILDVRNPDEIKFVSLPNSLNIPLGQLSENLSKLPNGVKIVTLCHLGVRSLRAALFLRSQGYEAFSAKGGIDAWSVNIDQKLPRY